MPDKCTKNGLQKANYTILSFGIASVYNVEKCAPKNRALDHKVDSRPDSPILPLFAVYHV